MGWSKVTCTAALRAASSLAAGIVSTTCGGSAPGVANSEARLGPAGVGVGAVVGVAGTAAVARGAVALAWGRRVVPGLPELIGVDCCPPHAEASRVRSKKALKSRFFFMRRPLGLRECR